MGYEGLVWFIAISGNLTALLAFIFSIVKQNNSKEVFSRILMAIDKLNLTISTLRDSAILAHERNDQILKRINDTHEVIRDIQLKVNDISKVADSNCNELVRVHNHIDEFENRFEKRCKA